MALLSGKHGIVLVHGTEETLPRGEFIAKFTNFMADGLLESPIQCDQCNHDSIYPVIEREADMEAKPATVKLRIKSPRLPVWEAGRYYSTNSHVLPSVPNGFRYRCVQEGISDKKEPDWKTSPKVRVDDGEAAWETEVHRIDCPWEKGKEYKKQDIVGPEKPNGFRYKCVKKGKAGDKEPDWKTTADARTEDGTVVWKAIPHCVHMPWKPDFRYKKGICVSPTTPNGYYYECINEGKTGNEEPVWPAEDGATIKDDNINWKAKPDETEWVFKEAHWVKAFTPPSASNVLRWGLKVLPKRIKEMRSAMFSDRSNLDYSPAEEQERRKQEKKEEESDYKPHFLVSFMYQFSLICTGVLFFLLSFILTPLLYIFWFLWWLPLGLILKKDTNAWWTSIPSFLHAGDAFLTNALGDTKRVLEHGVWAANIRGIVENIVIEMMEDDKIEDITIVAHSLGCAVVYDTLMEDGKIAQKIDQLNKRKKITFVSVGSAVNLVLTAARDSNTYAKTRFNRPFDKRIIGSGPDDFFWLDIWARFDPIRFLRIEWDKVRELGVSKLQWKSRKVVNLDNPMGDHSYYWLNKDRVVPRIARAINRGTEYPWFEAGITDKKLRRHDKKVAWLAMMRLVMIAAIIGSVVWFLYAGGWDMIANLFRAEPEVADNISGKITGEITDMTTGDITHEITGEIAAKAPEEGNGLFKWLPFVIILVVYALYEIIRSWKFGDVSGGTANPESSDKE